MRETKQTRDNSTEIEKRQPKRQIKQEKKATQESRQTKKSHEKQERQEWMNGFICKHHKLYNAFFRAYNISTYTKTINSPKILKNFHEKFGL